MKHLILATTIAFGLAGVGSAVAQNQTKTTTMPNVTVSETPAEYEIYFVDLHLGYGLRTLVGNTHRQYMEAQRAAEKSEALRIRGMAAQPYVSVAIDNSPDPGVARQIQLSDSARQTIAIVNVYCKRTVPSGGSHCRLAPLHGSANTDSQRLASRLSAITVVEGKAI